MTFGEILDNFALIEDWEDRYRYIIELGRSLPAMSEDLKTEKNKVRGCVSQVWIQTQKKVDQNNPIPLLHILGDSDAMIVRGLIAILLSIYQDKPADEIARHDALKDFAALGLKEHLTPQRSNGLASMVARLRLDANEALAITK